MDFKSDSLLKSLSAKVTFVQLIVLQMGLQMYLQKVFASKAPVTNATLERFLSGVDQAVGLEVVTVVEAFVARRASKRLLLSMLPDVTNQTSALLEYLLTFCTLVPSLVWRVRFQMLAQFARFGKYFWACSACIEMLLIITILI